MRQYIRARLVENDNRRAIFQNGLQYAVTLLVAIVVGLLVVQIYSGGSNLESLSTAPFSQGTHCFPTPLADDHLRELPDLICTHCACSLRSNDAKEVYTRLKLDGRNHRGKSEDYAK